RTGFASSCSPRAFIRSKIFCGRATSVSVCVVGGVTVVVEVVLELSEFAAHELNKRAKLASSNSNGRSFVCRPMLVLRNEMTWNEMILAKCTLRDAASQ